MMNSKSLSVKEQYAMAYKSYKECVECCDNKYEWAASKVFGLATYDGNLDKMFVEKICEVCKCIAERRTYEYIDESEENYITYILVCQVLHKKDWINWGTSIRGAFFDGYYSGNPILEWSCSSPYDVLDISVPFNMKNIMDLVTFIEEAETGDE